jgi:hypothetical protein
MRLQGRGSRPCVSKGLSTGLCGYIAAYKREHLLARLKNYLYPF